MGGSSSKRRSNERLDSYSRTSSNSWNYPPPQSPYVQQSQDHHLPRGHYGTPSQTNGGGGESKMTLDGKYSMIGDNYVSLDQVTFSFQLSLSFSF